MSDYPQPKRAQRFIDGAVKAAFLAALRSGARREDAADSSGFSLMGFYGARSRDPAFAAAWAEALALPPAGERRARAYERRGYQERGEVLIAPCNRRLLQRRRRRHVRFDENARATFLAHFASDCDTNAAAAAAGVSVATIHYRRRKDPDFAAAYAEALAEGYAHLEAELLRRRLAAQKKLREAIESAPGPRPVRPATPEDEAAEFARAMKLLAHHDRKPRRPERGFREGGRRQAWTFDRAILALGRKLDAMGAPPAPRHLVEAALKEGGEPRD